MIAWLFLSGLLVPCFGIFDQYFLLDVVQLSKFTYSVLSVLGFFCALIGTAFFMRYLQGREYRHLILMDSIFSCVLTPLSLVFILRLNVQWGVPDLAIILFKDTVQDIASQCFVFLPLGIVFAKICPKNIEATSFSLLATVSNFRWTIRSFLGTWINETFIHVSKSDLSNYYVLVIISFIYSAQTSLSSHN